LWANEATNDIATGSRQIQQHKPEEVGTHFNASHVLDRCPVPVSGEILQTCCYMDLNGNIREHTENVREKIIRKIYGPVMENNTWTIRHNEEINTLYKGDDIVRFIKSQRVRWLGHVKRVEDNTMPKRIFQKKKRKT
jgi:hypothetical protein